MAGGARKTRSFDPVEEAELRAIFKEMEKSGKYNTVSKYHNDTAKYPDNKITFSDTHIAYLKRYPQLNPQQYIQNLRLSTKHR